MLGYDVSFAFIHAVKLAQQGSILEKRVGMIGLTTFFIYNWLLSCTVVIQVSVLRDCRNEDVMSVVYLH